MKSRHDRLGARSPRGDPPWRSETFVRNHPTLRACLAEAANLQRCKTSGDVVFGYDSAAGSGRTREYVGRRSRTVRRRGMGRRKQTVRRPEKERDRGGTLHYRVFHGYLRGVIPSG